MFTLSVLILFFLMFAIANEIISTLSDMEANQLSYCTMMISAEQYHEKQSILNGVLFIMCVLLFVCIYGGISLLNS